MLALSLSLSLFLSPSPNQRLFLTANIIGVHNPIDRPQHAVCTPHLSPSPNQSLFLTANVIGRNPKPGEWLRAYRGLKMTVRWTAI